MAKGNCRERGKEGCTLQAVVQLLLLPLCITSHPLLPFRCCAMRCGAVPAMPCHTTPLQLYPSHVHFTYLRTSTPRNQLTPTTSQLLSRDCRGPFAPTCSTPPAPTPSPFNAPARSTIAFLQCLDIFGSATAAR